MLFVVIVVTGDGDNNDANDERHTFTYRKIPAQVNMVLSSLCCLFSHYHVSVRNFILVFSFVAQVYQVVCYFLIVVNQVC